DAFLKSLRWGSRIDFVRKPQRLQRRNDSPPVKLLLLISLRVVVSRNVLLADHVAYFADCWELSPRPVRNCGGHSEQGDCNSDDAGDAGNRHRRYPVLAFHAISSVDKGAPRMAPGARLSVRSLTADLGSPLRKVGCCRCPGNCPGRI